MTVREGFRLAQQQMSAAEARYLLKELFGWGLSELTERRREPLTAEQEQHLRQVLTQLKQGQPLQYLLGHCPFMDRDYFVGEGVLIPRDDTEVAVRQGLSFLRHVKAPNVIDLCAGSGIIALTIAGECPDARVTAVEKEPAALDYLRRNVQRHGANRVEVVAGDIFVYHEQVPDDSVDLLVSNPPYIRTDELPHLQKEVQHEPVTALDGGADGLRFYHCIAAHWLSKLKIGGGVVLEIGEEQGQAIEEMLSQYNITDIKILQDIQGLDRVIFGTKKA